MSASLRQPSFLATHSSADSVPLFPFAPHPYALDTTSLHAPEHQQHTPRTPGYCMNPPQNATFDDSHPSRSSHRVYAHDFAYRTDAALAAPHAAAKPHHNWSVSQPSMGAPVLAHSHGLTRAGSHHNSPPVSSAPVSPYGNSVLAYAPSNDFSSTYQHADYPKNIALSANWAPQSYYPGVSSAHTTAFHPPMVHPSMGAFGIDYRNIDEIPAPDFGRSARHSMSSYGNDSPATPQSVPADAALDHNLKPNGNGNDLKKSNGHIQLFRTESEAFQDELYNPPTTYASTTPTVTKPTPAFLSPHRNVMSERLQSANRARAQSPTSAAPVRAISPFRDHSPLAPAGDWRAPSALVGTAAGMRQHQKEQAEQAEYAQHMPQLQREPTKTISPKDAVLDYSEQDQPSLFSETIPQGYKQHNTAPGTETWTGNGFVSQPASFGNLQASQPDPSFAGPTSFNFSAMAPPTDYDQTQLPTVTYQNNTFHAPKMGSYLSTTDANPPFPATLTSTESSHSDNPPESQNDDPNNMIQRPADTRANTGTYTCTYHGCTQRFDTPANLQKHKRGYHRAQNQQQLQRESATATASSRGSGSSSPPSDYSPAPSGSGMTSAALQARNSQAGPHKCTRINPSTGKPCNTIFSRPYDLTRHEDTIHSGRKQKVRCLLCREEKTFSRNDALTRHMRVVHPEVESFGKRSRRD